MFRPNIIQTHEPYDPRLEAFLESFAFDRLSSLGGLVWTPASREELPDNESVDGYGCRYRYMGVGLPYCTHSPLATAETVRDVERFAWPDPEAPDLIAPDARERARTAREESARATAVGVPGMLFHQYHYLRGFEQWMVDIKLNRDLLRATADRIHHITTTLLMRLLEEVGEYTDIVSAGDDFGTSTAPYMSPRDFRELVVPYYRDLVSRVKSRFPHIRFYLHSHGQIMDLVPDLVDCGVDILNPVLPLDNMDPVRLKAHFGDRLSFEGGIDIEHVLPFGTLDEVRDHVRRVIDILGPGGGYLFKAQAISPVIPAEHVITTYELALEYGRYS